MKKKPILLLMSLLLLLGSSFVLYTKLKSTTDSQLPVTPASEETVISKITEDEYNVTFQDGEGKQHKLSDFIGKPIVLNFWASWCPPCRQEMPLFQKEHESSSEVQFLLINQTDGQRETKQKAQEFMSNENLTMPIYFDETNESMMKYGLNALPTTVFIDAEGVIKSKTLGAVNEESFQMYLDEIK